MNIVITILRTKVNCWIINNNQSFVFFLGFVEDHAFGCQHQTSNAAGVNQSCSNNLSGVNNSALFQVNVLASGSIESFFNVALFEHLSSNEISLKSSVLSDDDCWHSNGVLNNSDTCNFTFSQACF